ncbi:MAG: hypothetical protein DYG98_25595 [Haliscomenobacteraceae bacterium CHB4]|nr:hypothetical protein [Haliscomenobacteraceae bacterium CHB4]
MADEHLRGTIEKYLLGELSKAESERLEADMATDPTLFEQVEIQRLGLMGMRRLAAADLKEKFVRWDKELDAQRLSPANRNIWIWITGILLLLLTAGAFWHFEQIKTERRERENEHRQIAFRDSIIAVLQAGYREKAAELEALMAKPGDDSLTLLEIKRLQEELARKDKALRELEQRRPAGNRQVAMRLAPPPLAVRGGWDDSDTELSAARKAFDKPDYNEALRLLKGISADDPRQVQVTQMLPYALFYAGRFQEAIPAFLNLWEQDEDNEMMNAQGYLMLCYIAEGKILEAKQMQLVIIQNPRHKFYQTAVEAGKEIK